MTDPATSVPWEDILRWVRAEAGEAALRFGLRGPDRDDLEQDICLRIVVHVGRFRPDPEGATLQTWIRMHAKYEAVDSLRRRKRAMRQRPDEAATSGDGLPAEGAWTAEDAATYGELERAYRECLGRLPAGPRDRYLRAREARDGGESLSDAAHSLGIGLERLKEVLKAARKSLLRCLQERGFLAGIPPPGGPAASVSPPG